MQLRLSSCIHAILQNAIASRCVAVKTLTRASNLMKVVHGGLLLGAGPSVDQGLYDIEIVLRDCRL